MYRSQKCATTVYYPDGKSRRLSSTFSPSHSSIFQDNLLMPSHAIVRAFTTMVIMMATYTEISVSLYIPTTFAFKGAAMEVDNEQVTKRLLSERNDDYDQGSGDSNIEDKDGNEEFRHHDDDSANSLPMETSSSTLPAPSSDEANNESLLISLLRSWIA
ncbi:hypothetical protein Plhal304r1_c062g0149781 [Plasmopara halstedii]